MDEEGQNQAKMGIEKIVQGVGNRKMCNHEPVLIYMNMVNCFDEWAIIFVNRVQRPSTSSPGNQQLPRQMPILHFHVSKLLG
jgi:hypothetical protein